MSLFKSMGMILWIISKGIKGENRMNTGLYKGLKDEELVEMLRELLSVIDVGDDPRPMSNRSRNMRTKAVRKYLDRYLLS